MYSCFIPYSVDSLLQVHALYNLLDVLARLDTAGDDDAEKDKYKLHLVRLETKYMANCSELVSTIYLYIMYFLYDFLCVCAHTDRIVS